MKREEIKLLVEQARAGDQQAYTALYEATSQTVYRTVHAMVRSEELTLDIQQDVYVQAFTHLDRLSDPEKFLPWIRTIAVNQTRTVLRREQPILFSELEELSEADAADVPDRNPEVSPELALDQKETSRLVHEILDGLTDAQRMLVGMYYYEQIPVKQIAEDLGVSQGSVKSQLFRSRKKVEAEVRRLEKKGVKLYGLSPLPFLLGLLRNERLEAEAGKKVLAAAVNEAVKPAALHVGRAFFETLAGKLVLGVLAAGVIGGGAAGWRFVSRLNATYGDTRPTDSSFEAVLEHRDSNEDLPTPPVTTEPDTEPQNSSPVTTEPAVQTTVDAPEDLPSESADPQPANLPSADPKPTDPSPTPSATEPSSFEFTVPTVPWGNYPVGDDPVVEYWNFPRMHSHYSIPTDLKAGTEVQLEIVVRGVTQLFGIIEPSIRSSDPSVILVSNFYQRGPKDNNGQTYFLYTLYLQNAGSCTVTCTYADTPKIVIPMTVESDDPSPTSPSETTPPTPAPTEPAPSEDPAPTEPTPSEEPVPTEPAETTAV